MKAVPLLLTVTLGLNAIALAAIGFWPAESVALAQKMMRTTPTSTPPAPRVAERNRAIHDDDRGVSNRFSWSGTLTRDLPALEAHLRDAGFPPGLVRKLVMEAAGWQFQARRFALHEPNTPQDYWITEHRRPPDRTREKEMRELDREQVKLLRELFGPDLHRPVSDEEHAANQRRQYGDLAPAKVDQIKRINADYDELSSKVREDSMGVMLPEDRAKLSLLEREKRADLERLLSADELLDYDLRNSRPSHELRGRLGRFQPTEEEFRALFAVQKAFDDRYPMPGGQPMGQEFMRERQQASQQLEAQYASVLGDARAEEYRRSRQATPNHDMLDRLVTRLELPPATTATIVSVQQDIQQRAAGVRSDRTLSPEQRAADLAALAGEATLKLTQALGPRGMEGYRQNGGQWLQMLVRQAASPEAMPVRDR